METTRELVVDILPTGDLSPAFESAGTRLGKKQQKLNHDIYARYLSGDQKWLLFLGCSDTSIVLSPSLGFWRRVARAFIEKLKTCPGIEQQRHNAEIEFSREELDALVEAAPLMTGMEYLDTNLVAGVLEALISVFRDEIKIFKGKVGEFFYEFSPHVHLAGRVFFHLVENKDNNFPFQFLATYASKTGMGSKHRPLHYALEEFKNQEDQLLELLTTVHTAAAKSRLLKSLLDTGELFHHLAWNTEEAYEFLQQIHLFEQCGIICRIPDWWKKHTARPVVKIQIGNNEPSLVGADALLDFKAEICLGDEVLSIQEVKNLLSQSSGLARIKNRWTEVDREKLEALLNAYEKAMTLNKEEGLTINEALQLQLHPQQLTTAGSEADIEISSGEWFESIIRKLKNPEQPAQARALKEFGATLRPYQHKGVNWLLFLDSLKLGACLADDMGLGKTIQVLGFLSVLKNSGQGSPCLLIIPASLLSNWENEINRFLPGLRCFIAHPGYTNGRGRGKKAVTPNLKTTDLVITTYAIAQRHKWISEVSWRCLILDEAQAIKNPGTKQAKCVKKIKAGTRITMTGTPIENNLGDLWSLFDFLNPGLLGTAKAFKRFSAELKKSPEGYKRLKKVVAPFILRRMKTDKAIVSDLPEKVEMKTFPRLTKKQVVLYQDFVEELQRRLAEAEEGIQRKGIILSSLIKFKQICNHPDQYLGTGGYAPEESGKFLRLKEICETIYAKRERVLVFTQFKEMADPLANFLETVFHKSGPVIHGSIGIKKRKEAIEYFQEKAYVPFMVLSLKAGGTGLNLTRANHVIHFDRWWNPAVEDQATDRAFRIGQKKGVLVHKFITRGTIEDKIDVMIENKKAVSQKIIAPSDDTLITEMDNKALMDMFTLTL
ncbi:MAG: DEAD/DEAH box helicase [Thermodesulfobacteriota bacterium]|nr:DEAD/DEAH box helicase [Thermodesulfobacteriota bacterium]